MTSEFFTNATQFIVTILGLCVVAGVFAAILYFLFWRRLNSIKALYVTKNGEVPDGVPFYIKKSRLIHETSYLETLTTYTLTAKKVTLNSQNKRVREEIAYHAEKTVSLSGGGNTDIPAIRDHLLKAQIAQDIDKNWKIAREKFEGLEQYIGQKPKLPLPMEENTIKDIVYVDYQNTFYLNKLQPLSGSSELGVELSSDGTLTKSTAKSEDTTLEKLLGFLPMDKIVSQLIPAPKAAEATVKAEGILEVQPEGETILYEFSLAVEYKLLRHILSTEIDNLKRDFLKPLELKDDTYWYRREIITTTAPEPEKPAAAPKPVEPAAAPAGNTGDTTGGKTDKG